MNTEWQTLLQHYHANSSEDEVRDYGNKSRELQAVLQTEVMVDLSHFSAVVVSGQDAEKFLQGQLTCDMREVRIDQSRLSAYCTVKGRIMASCRVVKQGNDYWLWLPRSMRQSLLTQLKKYALFSKVTLTFLEDHWISFGCAGTHIIEKIQQPGYPVKSIEDSITALPQGMAITIAAPQPRVIFLTPINAAMAIWQQLAADFRLAGADAWRLLDIAAGIATIYPVTRELFTPHMLDYPKWHAVSFTKGCYLGQEIVARAEHLGRTKRQLCRAKTVALQRPAPGDKLQMNNEDVGVVVEVALSCGGGYEVLAVVTEEAVRQVKPAVLNGQELKLELSTGNQGYYPGLSAEKLRS